MRSKNQLISALPALTPTSIIDTSTGEYLSQVSLQDKIGTLVSHIHAETLRLYSLHKDTLITQLADYRGVPQPAEYARQAGLLTNFRSELGREIKVKSRLEKLVQYKLISETASYVLNPTPGKREPSFSLSINLGAVDKAMITLSSNDSELTLVWKCWDKEYYLTFAIPAYILKRNIIKYSLPLIRKNKRTSQYEFIFNLVEKSKVRKGSKHTVGIDLGIIKPYSMALVNQNGARVASYESSARLNRLSRKRVHLIQESRNIREKIKNRESRGLESPLQVIELDRTQSKATRLTGTIALQTGSEIARKLTKHNSNLIHVESLKWISGSASSKIGSSKWSHAQQQAAITHATTRIGYSTKRVNPRGTSQACHSCGGLITHDTKNRTVHCDVCKSKLDRDFNAAMNIAKNMNKSLLRPVSKKLNGGVTRESNAVLIKSTEAFIGLLDNNLLMARKTT